MKVVRTSSKADTVPEYLKLYREHNTDRKKTARLNGSFYRQLFWKHQEEENTTTSTIRTLRTDVIEVHLIRHGQTQSYAANGGLTSLGALQARQRGWRISREVKKGESVVVVAAGTKRALRTADFLLCGLKDGLAALEKYVRITGPTVEKELQNFLVSLPGGMKDPTIARRYCISNDKQRDKEGAPLWLEEVIRFWSKQESGKDPIEYWMSFPLSHFEAPGAVVRRYWAGLMRIAREQEYATRIICAVHSGPMRAFAAAALGCDLGEPNNTEEVRVQLKRDLSGAVVFYRRQARKVAVPKFEGF